MNNIKGHYVEQSVVMNLGKLASSQAKENAVETSRCLFFTVVLPSRYIAEQEFLKVYDWYDEHHQLKFQTKKWFQAIRADFSKYNVYLSKTMTDKARNLIFDLCNQVCGKLEKEVQDLNLTFKFYFERKGLKNCDLMAQIETARTMINLYDEVYKAHIQLFKDEYYMDFSERYKEADLAKAASAMYAFADSVFHYKKNNIHPCKNYASEQAYRTINEKLSDGGLREGCCLDALKLGHFDEEVKECEAYQMGVDRLEDKFKVSRM